MNCLLSSFSSLKATDCFAAALIVGVSLVDIQIGLVALSIFCAFKIIFCCLAEWNHRAKPLEISCTPIPVNISKIEGDEEDLERITVDKGALLNLLFGKNSPGEKNDAISIFVEDDFLYVRSLGGLREDFNLSDDHPSRVYKKISLKVDENLKGASSFNENFYRNFLEALDELRNNKKICSLSLGEGYRPKKMKGEDGSLKNNDNCDLILPHCKVFKTEEAYGYFLSH